MPRFDSHTVFGKLQPCLVRLNRARKQSGGLETALHHAANGIRDLADHHFDANFETGIMNALIKPSDAEVLTAQLGPYVQREVSKDADDERPDHEDPRVRAGVGYLLLALRALEVNPNAAAKWSVFCKDGRLNELGLNWVRALFGFNQGLVAALTRERPWWDPDAVSTVAGEQPTGAVRFEPPPAPAPSLPSPTAAVSTVPPAPPTTATTPLGQPDVEGQNVGGSPDLQGTVTRPPERVHQVAEPLPGTCVLSAVPEAGPNPAVMEQVGSNGTLHPSGNGTAAPVSRVKSGTRKGPKGGKWYYDTVGKVMISATRAEELQRQEATSRPA